MKEYVLIKMKDEYKDLYNRYPYIATYFTENFTSENAFLQQQYCHLLDEVGEYSTIIDTIFKNRTDYRKQDNFYCIKNEMTKEICILIIKRYQIIAKCDKISNVLIDTLLGIDPDFIILDKVS